jgi:hypothetical protein
MCCAGIGNSGSRNTRGGGAPRFVAERFFADFAADFVAADFFDADLAAFFVAAAFLPDFDPPFFAPCLFALFAIESPCR